ncbi:MAG: ATP-dependent metallopeptidase FtsH/Yme1/Tma family protein [Acidobacteria bacterium]|nr:MAG: ATP-dependent metallopeptidase FtsH/Yme1/Tma family protein [Acidobacteriota bacterium]
MNTTAKNVFLWIVIIVAVVVLWNFLSTVKNGNVTELTYSEFTAAVDEGRIKSTLTPVVMTGNKVEGKYLPAGTPSENNFRVLIPKGSEETIANALNAKGVKVKVADDDQGSWIYMILSSGFPIILFVAFWIFLMRQMQAGGNKALSFGKSRAKLTTNQQKRVTFKEVAGVEEAKEELQEIVEFLREPQKFQKLGGRIPKGVLLMGPPGTGKTLLARAIAGEANVPFFSISGSDFVEMFVGVGASRVRDLFEQGKKNAPCIIFIDEIDAVGRHRGAGLGGGHDEREQTLNQLLVEMDGFESNEGVILIAATNRPDVLDPALLRPGRFDRQVVVTLPDIKGREGILKVHMRRIPMAEDVDVSVLARGTPGFSGAQLANLVNEAALNAARYNRKAVTMVDFEEAKDKVLMGKERKSMVMNEKEKRNTAYHEAGHALVAYLVPEADPLHKVTIIPRGRALGVTMQLPEEDKYNYTREYMEASIAILLAGRAAEEIFLGSCTTGASNDLERATERARKMVCEWGMSDAMGPLTFGKKEEQIFLGREIAQHQDYSEDTAVKIDQEVKKIVLDGYQRAKELLEANRAALTRVAEALLEYESLDLTAIQKIVRGEKFDEEINELPPGPPVREPEKEEERKKLPSLVKPKERPAPA